MLNLTIAGPVSESQRKQESLANAR